MPNPTPPDELTQAITNALGDSVYFQSSQGRRIRARVTPSNTITAGRTRVRTFLADAATIWNDDLEEYQRDEWRRAARAQKTHFPYRDQSELTGWNYFHRVNLTRQNCDTGFTLDVPPTQPPDPLTSLTITTLDAAAPTIILDTAGAAASDTYIIVKATPSLPATRAWKNKYLSQIAVLGPAATPPFDLSTAWANRFGTMTPGDLVGFCAYPANGIDGSLGARLYTSGLAVGGFTIKGYRTSQAASGSQNIGAVDRIQLASFDLAGSLPFSNIGVRIGVNDATHLYDFGVYSDSGSLVAHTGAITPPGTGPRSWPLAGGNPVTLTPGTYYFAWTGNGTTLQLNNNAQQTLDFLSSSYPVETSTDGVLPDTITIPDFGISDDRHSSTLFALF